ncbi:MAG: GtrA family protein [Alphaproteobacteria bacterium]|nr:MAG: GtrA family protein [Alphaproteobacteria bacterium]
MVASANIARFARYVIASFAGTVADLGAFLLLYSQGVLAGLAAAIGYSCGTLIHWLVSSRYVFPDRLSQPGIERGGQQVLFVISAMIGLGLTTLIVGAAETFGSDPRIAKLFAMGLSFATVWLIRLTLVFRRKA